VNTTAIGSSYERAAATFLENEGIQIIETNWRTRWCEIDLVGRDQQGVIHIIEVRYRKSADSGDGLASITPAKQRQLIHAAKRWMMLRGAEWGIQIDVVGMTNDSIEYIPNAVQEY
jgi:uncharacterized protein (TIGR00252 family)